MKLGIVGLGKMGLNMALRLRAGGHAVAAYDHHIENLNVLTEHGGSAAKDLADLVRQLAPPRVVWLMIGAGKATERALHELIPLLSRDDIVVDGGNANYHDSRRRAELLQQHGIRFMDAGTSGGIWGRELGYCLMIGGDAKTFAHLEPIFRTLAPTDGYLHVGPAGAGHFTKMIHNGIEYGMLQAYAEGFELLKASDYSLDLAKIAHLWNQGSVVRSWLLELAERAFAHHGDLEAIRDFVEDSGEGRWTVQEAIDKSVPAPVITLSLIARFRSRQPSSFSAKVIAALRKEFGGHAIKPTDTTPAPAAKAVAKKS